MDPLPIALRNSLEAGNAVLFLGAGIGRHALDTAGRPGPTGDELALELAEHFGVTTEDNNDLSQIAQLVELRKGRMELEAFLSSRLAGLEPDETLLWLFSIPWKAIFTTNYDRVIERAYERLPNPQQQPISIGLSSEVVDIDPLSQVGVYHLHGSLFPPNGQPRLVLTEDDYAVFAEKRRMLFSFLQYRFATAPFLYLGYSHRDPNWKSLWAELRKEFQPSSPPVSFRLAPRTDIATREILASQGLHTIDATLAQFVETASATIGEVKLDPGRFSAYEDAIPADLRPEFDAAPVAVTRLLNSWMYVNQEDFGAPPNTHSFLEGDLPNWPLVSQDIPFARDIEEPLLEELFDYATTANPRITFLSLLAPAGYGVSTVLMRLAARLVSEGAGKVFMHRRGTQVVDGDVEFMATLGPERVFLFIDNASDAAEVLPGIAEHLKTERLTACLILGDRLNEWRKRRPRIPGREYQIDPLSEVEIDRLLDFLSSQQALGELEHLDRDLRVSAIRVRHEKQLLIAMKEATNGKGFDAIVEDEYRSIPDDFSKFCYAAVCCFYRLRALPRAEVLAAVLGTTLVELYDRTRGSLEGVVFFDRVDEARGIDAARARHHGIAEIVWQRGVLTAEKDQLTRAALDALNLNYHLDLQAFEHFVRDDAVDSIHSLEGKMRFFESACRKDPTSPYVRQHYARMLRKEGLPEQALDEIEKAIGLGPDLRVLYHTKGVILRDLALEISSVEIARRRLAQSEEAFRTSLRLYSRDEYAFQGLAELYVGWAKRSPSPDEELEYLTRAEETIADGLKVVRAREGLWIVSASIKQWLGDDPKRISALKQAVQGNQSSIVARYLLGRAYRETKDPRSALEILRPVVEGHPEEFRAAVVYALALEDLGEPYDKAIAVLRQSTLYGYSDPRFIATLGGMLYMCKEFSEANEVFAQSRKRDFPFVELRQVQFVPRVATDGARVTLEGIVASVTPGFIRVAGYQPDFFIRPADVRRAALRTGMRVRFHPAFSAHGPQAQTPVVLQPDPHLV